MTCKIILKGWSFVEKTIAILSLSGAILALLFAIFKASRVMKFSDGNEKMKTIAQYIKTGANAYLKRQYKVVAIFFAIMFVLLFVLSRTDFLSVYVPFAFITGGLYSALAGFVGMKIATSANAKTANACSESLNKGLNVAFSAGSVMGFTVVGLGLLDVSIWYILLQYVFDCDVNTIAETLVTFGMGASSMALFARVGGGVFTKAADVGADLVGKVEAGIPEDDPRNPAVIADNVGDNVGDVAGMGADLYESYFGAIVSACALGVSALSDIRGLAAPILMAFLGIVASLIGSFFVKTGEKTDQKLLLKALRRGTNLSAVLVAIGAYPLIYFILGKENISLYIAVLAGLVSGVLIGTATEFFTSDTYKPTQKLAKSSETGSATTIISGMSLGMLSTAVPIIIVAACILVAYYVGGKGESLLGLYGIGLAAVGMLSTLGITLASDAYGPVADNAGGIAQMAGLPEDVRERTDALDSLGNTTAATGKGFAIGSAALTALALIASYVDKINTIGYEFDMTIMNPSVLVGFFIGGCLPFVFSALTMESVGKAAQHVVTEVRRQFKEIKGIMTGEKEADYASCIDICTKASLTEMILPTIVAVATPVVTGLILGPNGVIGLLAGATVTGFLLAIMMSNSGGAWDNAKKYIESGYFGGKGSSSHKAGVVGDTVGDPFKDTSGPAINILIKLLSTVSIVFAAVVANFHLLG